MRQLGQDPSGRLPVACEARGRGLGDAGPGSRKEAALDIARHAVLKFRGRSSVDRAHRIYRQQPPQAVAAYRHPSAFYSELRTRLRSKRADLPRTRRSTITTLFLEVH